MRPFACLFLPLTGLNKTARRLVHSCGLRPRLGTSPCCSLLFPSEWCSVATEQEWKSAGKLIGARRFEVGFRSQEAFAQALGVTVKWVNNIENGRAYPYRPTVVSATERLLGWAPGSIDRVVAGEHPIELPPAAPVETPLSELGPAELVAQINERLTALARLAERRADRHLTGDPLVDYPGGSVMDADDMPTADVTPGRPDEPYGIADNSVGREG